MVQTPYRFCVLAPFGETPATTKPRHRIAPQVETKVTREYFSLLASMQRLRGALYLADGAVPAAALTADGRLRLPDDEHCWHLLLIDNDDAVIGCVRYRRYAAGASFADLRLRHSDAARHPVLGSKVRRAVEHALVHARQQGLYFVEIGGWALHPEWRHTQAALRLLVASYALGEIWGGCVGIATATVRHRSAAMLRRMGGTALHLDGEDLPPYQDKQYGCLMELLRFNRTPNPRFVPLVAEVVDQLQTSRMVYAQPVAFPAVA